MTQGFDDFSAISREEDFAALRSHPGFRELFGPIDLGLRYTAVWGRDSAWESQETHGLAPGPHLARCRSLGAQGFLPASIAVVPPRRQCRPRGRVYLATAEDRGRRPRYPGAAQSRAAVALARLGRADRIWPLLRMAPDPSLRTYLIHDLGPARR